jgi:hypothetical protein
MGHFKGFFEKSQEMPHYMFCPRQKKTPGLSKSEENFYFYVPEKERERERGERVRAKAKARERKRKGKKKGKGNREREGTKVRALIFLNHPHQSEKSANMY